MSNENPADAHLSESNPSAESQEDSASLESWDRYEILAELPGGNMAILYKAMHKTLLRACVIKVLNTEKHEDGTKRFLQEARILSSLKHKGIVKIFGSGFHEGKRFFVMEWLEGKSLDEIFKTKERLSPVDFRTVFFQIAEALAYAHKQKVIHRDIKPSNIFVGKDAETGHLNAKLLDFGIARLMEGSRAQEQNLTKSGAVLGTPAYMSPEQAKGETLDERSDIYSFGVVMYEALAGAIPFDGATTFDIIYKQSHNEADAAKLPRAKTFRLLNNCILKCLEKNKLKRYQSAEALLEDLKVACAKLDAASTEDSQEQDRLRYLLAAVLCVALGIGFAKIRESSTNKDAVLLSSDPASSNQKTLSTIQRARNYFLKAQAAGRKGEYYNFENYRKRSEETYADLIKANLAKISETKNIHTTEMLSTHINKLSNEVYTANCELANILTLEGKLDEAKQCYIRALEIEGNNHQLRSIATRELVAILVQKGKPEEAQDELKKLLQIPENTRSGRASDMYYWQNSCSYLQLAALRIAAGKFDSAKEYLKQSRQNYEKIQRFAHPAREPEILVAEAICRYEPETKKALLDKAYELIKSGNLDYRNAKEAAYVCRNCAYIYESMDPQRAKEIYLLAFEWAARGDSLDTIADVEEYACAFANQSNDADTLLEFINLADAPTLDLKKGISKKLSDGYPVQCEAKYALGTRAFLDDKHEAAIKLFEECIKLTNSERDTRERANLMLAISNLKSKHSQAAGNHLASAIFYFKPAQTNFSRPVLQKGLGELVETIKSNKEILNISQRILNYEAASRDFHLLDYLFNRVHSLNS